MKAEFLSSCAAELGCKGSQKSYPHSVGTLKEVGTYHARINPAITGVNLHNLHM